MKAVGLVFLILISGSLNAQTKEEVVSYFKEKNWSKVVEISTKVLNESPNDAELTYWRAIAFYYSENFDNCLADIEKAIRIDSNYAPVYMFKAQLKYAKNEKDAACTSLRKAISLGVSQARQLEQQYCGSTSEVINESLAIDWPDEEKWKLANRQTNKGVTMMELVRDPETLDNWTEIGTMMVIPKNGMNLTAQKAMELFETSAKQQSSTAEVKFIESQENIEYPYIIFKIENQKSTLGDHYESQVYAIIVGKENLFITFRAIKEKVIPENVQNKWVTFLKSGKIVKGQ